MPKKIFLIDGSAYIYRGYHALPPLSNSNGLPTNAILGFTNIITKLFGEQQPEYAMIVLDAKGPTFRHDMYPEYKANRPPMPDDLIVQIPYIRNIITGFRIPLIEKVGYEADDLIGVYAKLAETAGFSVIMVSGDKDLMQLVSDRAVLYDPMKDVWIDKEKVKEKIGVYPEQVTDIMGLTGDTSDNIPGVPGIGGKTAPKLIDTYGSLESLYEKIDLLPKNKMRENRFMRTAV